MKNKLDILLKCLMIISIFAFAFVLVGKYLRPIISMKMPFNIDIIAYIGTFLLVLDFLIVLIYLIINIRKYKNRNKK